MPPTTEPPNEEQSVNDGGHISVPSPVSPRVLPPRTVTEPVSERREAMNDHLGSWELEGAVPTGFGLEVVKKYVAGETDIDGAIDMLKKHDRNGGYSRHE